MKQHPHMNLDIRTQIAILYICTGKYNQFFHEFYTSCERYFLVDQAINKQYFVWTDDVSLCNADNVHLIYHACQGFPADSLFRFDMFLQKENELCSYDYIYFFNANALFCQPVGEEILPDDTGLVAAQWPGRTSQPALLYPYERNKQSKAYIAPFHPPYRYYMGGINGGTAKDYLAMAQICARNIRDDYDNGIIARFHDESHINKYLRSHPCKILSQEYCWPEEWPCQFTPKIIFRDKVKFDSYFNKGRDRSWWNKIKKIVTVLYDAIRWYL